MPYGEGPARISDRPLSTVVLDELPESLREQLRAYSRLIDERLPPEALHVYVTGWTT
ncbi:hypothetical protein [Streptomyces soliscabiei]|uniref:hypothetical protein n=1 Tax=Streptomyces soliscabiei TaxID=588897 RepID=UPI0029B1DEB1|nr:hypothetical protein [Streptomyces sp. NY05-11A]MDX2681428.1 hypothetical protein [Streptomyces sp. NY05-11A]